MSATVTPLPIIPHRRKGGRPKGCRCPLPCPIHPDKNPSPDASALREDGTLNDDALRVISGATDPPRSDPPPSRSKRRAKARKAPRAELESMLGEMLSLPAIPATMVLHCGYCAQHFATEGPNAAKQVVELAQHNPALLRALERMHEAWTAITWGTVLATYIGKPLLHHVAPEPILAQVGPVLGVPPRPPKPDRHRHQEPHAADAPAPAEADTAVAA